MVKRIAIIAILIPAALLFSFGPAIAGTQFQDIAAVSALLAEADSGTILFEYNMRLQHPADDLAKVMTLLLVASAIENGEVFAGRPITMTESAWFDVGSRSPTQNILPGEQMPLIDLMYSAYVGGASEACNLIAEHIAGSVESFIELMNVRAAELGCERTNFTNTHGQYDVNQYTTARDQFYIFREAMTLPLFIEISGVYRHTTEGTSSSEARRFVSSNSLLNIAGKYYYRYCTSGMTSATFEGGYSFVAAAESDGLSLISVVLGSNVVMMEDESAEMRNLTETRRLFEWGFSQFGWRTVLSSNIPVAKAPVTHGDGADFVNLRPESEIRLLLDKDIPDERFKLSVIIHSLENDEDLRAPVAAGDVLGEATLTQYDENDNIIEIYGPIQLVANTDIGLHRFEYIRMQISDVLSSATARYIMAILGILLAGYIALVIRYNVLRRKRLRKIREAKKRLIDERQQSEETSNEPPPPYQTRSQPYSQSRPGQPRPGQTRPGQPPLQQRPGPPRTGQPPPQQRPPQPRPPQPRPPQPRPQQPPPQPRP